MTYFQAIILGIVQGLTEFLPVSSSGHLVLVGHLLGVDEPGESSDVVFEVIVHLGTLLAVLIYFRKRIFGVAFDCFRFGNAERQKSGWWTVFLLFIATLPAVGAVAIKDHFKLAYSMPALVGFLLCLTGLLLLLPSLFRKLGGGPVRLPQAFLMGIGQFFAILPGISRSGTTIVVGMMAGASASAAAEFSFLMAIPALLGATILEISSFRDIEPSLFGPYAAGFLCAFLSGWAAVYGVLESIRRGKFQYFAYYCLVVGIAAVVYFGLLAKPAI